MNEVVAFAKLFVTSGVSPEQTRAALNRLRRSAELTKAVTTVVEEFPKIEGVVRDGSLAELKRFLRQPQIENITDLAGILDHPYAAFLKAAIGSEVFSKANLNPAPLVTGVDLIELGFKPGPKFKALLFAVETEQLEGNLTTKEDALTFVRDWHWAVQ